MTFVQNGCFLEVYCVFNGVARLEANLHLNSLTYVQTGSTTFVLRDNSARTFTGDTNYLSAYGSVPDVFAFLDPLRDDCQSGMPIPTAPPAAKEIDFELIERCDIVGDASTTFYYKVSRFDDETEVITTVSADQTAYTITGVVDNCAASDCVSENDQVEDVIEGRVETFPAGEFHSFSYMVLSGTATVTGTSPNPLTKEPTDPSPIFIAKECEFLKNEIIIDATNAVVYVVYIK